MAEKKEGIAKLSIMQRSINITSLLFCIETMKMQISR